MEELITEITTMIIRCLDNMGVSLSPTDEMDIEERVRETIEKHLGDGERHE